MLPEDLLHLFGPFLPTDRFRALLRGVELPALANGAALMVDTSGFTPLTDRLVKEFGARRASDELKRRLNPMFEAVAGQVFHHGGSVIRFMGDGFMAWFDDQQFGALDSAVGLPGVVRAVAAGMDMQRMMPLFRGLRLKIAIGQGSADRWVIGQSKHGLIDMLSGPALNAMLSIADHAQAGQVVVHESGLAALLDAEIDFEVMAEGPHGLARNVPDLVDSAARLQRWSAWQIERNANDALNAIRPFVASALRNQIESGFNSFVGELRYALPMFIELTDSVQHGDGARLELDQHISTIQDVLIETGGRIVSVEHSDKGRVVFAVFGAPITYGDDAERALTAALALRDSKVRSGVNIARRIGISRGMLYAGVIGGEVRHEYSTIGDETNVAARLMMAAQDGQILVTSHVRQEVTQRVIFRDLPALHIKGKGLAIAVSEPLIVETKAYHDTQTGELIGREHEIDQLQTLIKTVGSGSPRVFELEGQAGIGKSRLVVELIRLSAERGLRSMSGDCLSIGRNTAYLPWREIMTTLLHLPDGSPDERIVYISRTLAQININWMTRLPLLAELLQLPTAETAITAGLVGRVRSQALFALVTDIVLYFARQQPLLIIIEDVQWIDEVSEALTIELARRLSVDPAPILLTLVHRPLVDTDHAPHLIETIGELPIVLKVVLNELSLEGVQQLMERYLKASVPPLLLRFVYEKARGNPFFIQELLDTLSETGAVTVNRHIAIVNGTLSAFDLPSTLQGLVQARIDRLSETDKLLLKVASVTGIQFSVRLLAESLPIPLLYGELLERLRTLEDRDFIRLEAPEPDLTYVFKHAITQEVTYQSLPFAQRLQLHQAVGNALQEAQPDSIERLAYHFGSSGDTQRAWYYLMAAAHKTSREYANQAALDFLGQALKLTVDPTQRFDVLRRRLTILLRIGSMDRANSELAELATLADEFGYEEWRAVVHTLRADYFLHQSSWREVLAEAHSARELANRIHNEDLVWDASMLLLDAYRNLNQLDAVAALLPSLKVLSEQLDDTRKHLSLILQELNDQYSADPEAAMDGALTTLAQAEALADPALEADCWALIASFHSRNNDLLAALTAYKKQIALLRQVGDRRNEGHTLNNMGIALVSLGQFSDANTQLSEAYKILLQIGERWGMATSLVFLGMIGGLRRAYDEALAYMERGLAILRDLNAQSDIGLTLFQQGNVYLRKGKLELAEAVYTEALAIFIALNFHSRSIEVQVGLAEVAMLNGDLETAYTRLAELLPTLLQGRTNDFQQPGLVYYRAIQVMKCFAQSELVRQLSVAFYAHHDAILSRLLEPIQRDAYVNNIWYHRALVDVDFDARRA